MRHHSSFCIYVVTLLSASFSQGFSPVPGDALASCISDYRDGYYSRTVDCVQNALPELTTHTDSIEAYKLLALSYGLINQVDIAKMYFNALIEIDSTDEIDTLAFPPQILLIYNQVILEKKMSRMGSTKGQPRISQTSEKPGTIAIPMLLSSTTLTSGGAVFFYYKASIARKEYSKLSNDQKKLDEKWKVFSTYMASGVGCTIASGITTWLFFKTLNETQTTTVSSRGDGVFITFTF